MQSSKAYTYHRYSQDLRDQKKEKSTRQVLSVLRVDFNYSNALWIAMPSQKCGIASSGIVRLAATSLESVELVNRTLLERNSDHDACLERVLGYVRLSSWESRVVVASLFQHTLNL